VTINTLHVIYTTKLLLPQLVDRCKSEPSKKSAVLVVSSGLGSRPVAGTLTYSCTKSFVSFLAEGLNFECKSDNVDFLSYQAGEVDTKLLSKKGSKTSMISPERAANSSFRDLGLYSVTRGALRHEF